MTVTVDLRPVADLAPYARNARKHSEAAVRRLVAIIEDMGWTNPILVDDEGIVAGHKRRLAAMAIYAEGGSIRLPGGQELPAGTVPVLDVTGWTEEQRRAYILADNQTTLESEWDGETLRLELEWLDASGFDLSLSGFDGDALAAALKAPAELTDGVKNGGSGGLPEGADATILFGSYRAKISRAAFLRWEDDARADGDFSERQMLHRIVRMLGLNPDTDIEK